MAAELPLDLLAAHVSWRGTVLHLVSAEGPDDRAVVTLCGRRTQMNGRYVRVGVGTYPLRPSEDATCGKCIAAAHDRGDL